MLKSVCNRQRDFAVRSRGFLVGFFKLDCGVAFVKQVNFINACSGEAVGIIFDLAVYSLYGHIAGAKRSVRVDGAKLYGYRTFCIYDIEYVAI